jgi:hypothetical protein
MLREGGAAAADSAVGCPAAGGAADALAVEAAGGDDGTYAGRVPVWAAGVGGGGASGRCIVEGGLGGGVTGRCAVALLLGGTAEGACAGAAGVIALNTMPQCTQNFAPG